MKWIYEPVIIGHPYPALGGRFRCFNGEKWHDCDKYGRILNR